MTAKRLTTYALNKKFIKHWLIDHDTTQAELAEAVGVSPVVLSRYINDKPHGNRVLVRDHQEGHV